MQFTASVCGMQKLEAFTHLHCPRQALQFRRQSREQRERRFGRPAILTSLAAQGEAQAVKPGGFWLLVQDLGASSVQTEDADGLGEGIINLAERF